MTPTAKIAKEAATPDMPTRKKIKVSAPQPTEEPPILGADDAARKAIVANFAVQH